MRDMFAVSMSFRPLISTEFEGEYFCREVWKRSITVVFEVDSLSTFEIFYTLPMFFTVMVAKCPKRMSYVNIPLFSRSIFED